MSIAKISECRDSKLCANTEGGLVGGLWCRINSQLRDHLGTITLESVLAGDSTHWALRPRAAE